jgi:hypothetical protein
MANIVTAVNSLKLDGTQNPNIFVITYDDGSIKFVPADERNCDYMQYLAWKALGN